MSIEQIDRRAAFEREDRFLHDERQDIEQQPYLIAISLSCHR